MNAVALNLKFTFRTTPKDLFLAITHPSFLQNWLAPVVELDTETGVYTFRWTRCVEMARIIEKVPGKYVRWEWVSQGLGTGTGGISFRLEQDPEDELIDLYVTDYCEAGEEKAMRAGWYKQMKRLERLLG